LPSAVLGPFSESFQALAQIPAAFPPGDIWFPPADRADLKLIDLLDSAQSEIKFAFFDIELESIAQALIRAHNRGVLVKVVTDNNYLGSGNQVNALEAAGIEVKHDGDSGLMHNKFAVIDNTTVWMGSYNATENGTFYNNCNKGCAFGKQFQSGI
jgi:phosphatidylserine/phosphatidylglycerophosphate/cardiolipin synthase-like enzyme